MSPHLKTSSSVNADQRLSQLIKLKKLEKPDDTFWTNFEQEFRSRQLTTFVQIQPMHTRLRRACLIIARKAAPPVAAAGAVALTFFAISNTQYLAKDASEVKSSASPTTPPTEPTPEPDPFFIVNVSESSATVPEHASSDTTYQINALSSFTGSSNGYQLNATPVTYSQRSTAAQTSGVNVLTKQPEY